MIIIIGKKDANMIDINENIDTNIIFLKERLKIVSIKNTLLKILPIIGIES